MRPRAEKLGIENGALVEVTSPVGKSKIRAKVTEFIHPETAFMLHGFGKTAAARPRSCGRGASDALLQENVSDTIGGSPAFDHTIVQVRTLY